MLGSENIFLLAFLNNSWYQREQFHSKHIKPKQQQQQQQQNHIHFITEVIKRDLQPLSAS